MGCTPQGRILHLAREWESFSGFEFTRPPLPPLPSPPEVVDSKMKDGEPSESGRERKEAARGKIICYARLSTCVEAQALCGVVTTGRPPITFT